MSIEVERRLREQIARLEEQRDAEYRRMRLDLEKWMLRALETEEREREKDRQIDRLEYELSRRVA